MLWIAKALWVYRTEIYVGVQLLNALRRSAKEAAEAYVRNRFKQQLTRSVRTMVAQVLLLGGAVWLVQAEPRLASRLVASVILWWMTAYNVVVLFFISIPELKAVHRSLKSKRGYALRYFLQVSVVTELMQGSAIWLTLCLAVGWSGRTFFGAHLSYWKPWAELWWNLH